jgi:hypothetical protein
MKSSWVPVGAAIAVAASLVLVGCKEKSAAEKAGDEINAAAKKTESAVKDGAKKTGEAVEKTGEKVKDATK